MPQTYEPIATSTAGTATTSVTFASIPQTYTDLVLVSVLISQGNIFSSNIFLNNDSTNTYSCTRVYGSGAGAYSDVFSNSTQSLGGWGIGASTGIPITFKTKIFNYTNTTTNKLFLTIASEPPNSTGSNYTGLITSLWRNTSAINEVRFSTNANYGVGSTFTLYGIKAA